MKGKTPFANYRTSETKEFAKPKKQTRNIARETNHTLHSRTTADRYDIRTVSPLPCVFFSDLAHLFAFKKAGLFSKTECFIRTAPVWVMP